MAKKSLPKYEMMDSADKFEEVYSSNQPLIYRFMFWRTKDEMLAQDLTSSVFEKAWRTRKSFTGGSAKSWLFKIARTTLIDHWRKKKEVSDDGTMASELVSNTTDLDVALDRDLALTALQKAVAALPQEMRTVIQLRFIEGQSSREMAQALNISETNVRVIQYRALKKLRNYLQ